MIKRNKDITNKVNFDIDISSYSNLSKVSNDKALVNIRVILSRLGFNKYLIIIRSNNDKFDFYLCKSYNEVN